MLPLWIMAQQEIKTSKSEIIENIDGKDYYLHFVKAGETLFEIAKVYKVTVNDIFLSNPESQEGIRQGQILKIPLKGKERKDTGIEKKSDDYFFHIVKNKETYYGISKKYGVEIDEIKNLNHRTDENLKEGQTLKIPFRKKETELNQSEWEGAIVSHIVQPGETLYGIAKHYKVTIGEIKNANPGLTDQLSLGQEIFIPNQGKDELDEEAIAKEKEKKPDIEEHTVIKGETLYLIAKNYTVSIDSIKKYNPGLLTYDVYMGQVIKIPLIKPEGNYIIHKADKKDKLHKIAKKYGVDYYDVLVLNPGVHKKVGKGQSIKIPVEIPEREDSDSIKNKITEPKIKKPSCENIKANMEKTYNVALMLPLFLEEIDSLENKEETDASDLSKLISFRFIQFYEGFLMAVDSLKDAGMNLNLFVYDVDNSAGKIQNVLQASELSSMDLIIGPLFSSGFKKMAAYAKTYSIKIVNPLSIREEIVFGNPYVFKVKPAVSSQTDAIVSYIMDKYPESNIVIVRHNKYKYQSTVSYIKNYLNSKRKTRVSISNKSILDVILSKEDNNGKKKDKLLTENKLFDSEALTRSITDSTSVSNTVKEVIYVNDSIVSLQMNLSQVRNNIVIAISDEKVFSQTILSQLNKLRGDHDITLFGVPEWDKFDNLPSQHLLNLNFHSFTSTLVDFNNERIMQWVISYRNKYKTEPAINKFAFDGFDTGWYFLNSLFLYGKDFENCLNNYDIPLLQTKYKFEQLDGNGFENTYWNLGEYRDYEIIKIGD